MTRILAFALSLAFLSAQAAFACIDRMTDRDLAAAVERLSQATTEDGRDLAQQVKEQLDGGVKDYCAGYHLARYLTLAGDYAGARNQLIDALDHVTQEDLEDTAPWNLVGFTHLQEGDLFGALQSFEHQIEYETFPKLSDNTRMKVLNNAGFAALRLGQYDSAIETLSSARDLGSRTAVRNLQITESILATQKSGDIGAPGIFTTVLASRKNPDSVAEIIDRAGAALDGRDNIFVFLSQNGFHAITYGAYESYLKSEARRDQARQAGFDDAYVTALTEWQDVSAEFTEKR